MGFSLALGALPKELLEGKLDEVSDVAIMSSISHTHIIDIAPLTKIGVNDTKCVGCLYRVKTRCYCCY